MVCFFHVWMFIWCWRDPWELNQCKCDERMVGEALHHHIDQKHNFAWLRLLSPADLLWYALSRSAVVWHEKVGKWADSGCERNQWRLDASIMRLGGGASTTSSGSMLQWKVLSVNFSQLWSPFYGLKNLSIMFSFPKYFGVGTNQ